MGDDSTAGMATSFLRLQVVMVPLVLVLAAAGWLLDVAGMRDEPLANTLAVCLGLYGVIAPVSWLRHAHWGRHDKPAWLFLLMAMAWAFASLGAMVWLLSR